MAGRDSFLNYLLDVYAPPPVVVPPNKLAQQSLRNPAIEFPERYGLLPIEPLAPPAPRSEARAYQLPAAPRIQREVAETISPTMGAYGLSSLLTHGGMDAGRGKADPEVLAPLMLAILGPKATRVPNLPPEGFGSRIWYHGAIDPFDKFDFSRSGQNYFLTTQQGPAYFAPTRERAQMFAETAARLKGRGAPHVKEAYLRNPILDASGDAMTYNLEDIAFLKAALASRTGRK